MEQVLVETSAVGVPLRFEYHGRTWSVAAEPMRWYEPIDWSAEFKRLPRENAPQIELEATPARPQIRLGQENPCPKPAAS